MKKDYFDFGEPITNVVVTETVSKNGCKIEHFIINDKWKLTPTGNPDKPFKRRKINDKTKRII
jgi:hypothetical protein